MPYTDPSQVRYIINQRHATEKIALLSIHVIFTCLYCAASFSIPIHLRSQTLSILFIVSTLISIVEDLYRIIELVYVFKYYGQYMTENIWKSCVCIYKTPLVYKGWLSLINIILRVYIMSQFIPYEKMPSMFQDYDFLMTVMCIFGTVVLAQWCVFAAFCLLISCCLCIPATTTTINGIPFVYSNRYAIITGIFKFLPIIRSTPPHDKTCAICFTEAPCNNTVWQELPCHHRFHPECIQPWIKIDNLCPLCRQFVDVETTTITK